jgi:hypothetical protein
MCTTAGFVAGSATRQAPERPLVCHGAWITGPRGSIRSPATGFSVGLPIPCSCECGDPGQVAPDDQRLHRVGALVGVDDLEIGEMTGDVIVEQQPVAAENVPGLRAHQFGVSRGAGLRL